MIRPAGIALLPPLVQNAGLIVDAFFPCSSSSSSSSSASSSVSSPITSSPLLDSISHALHYLSEKKRNVTETYLHLIEDQVDRFLAAPAVGVQLRGISDRYLDEPPTNMTVIRRNADLLANCTQDAFNPHSELNQHLLNPLVSRVYCEFLDPLRQELFEFWTTRGKNFVDENRNKSNQKIPAIGNQQQQQQERVVSKLVSKCEGIFHDIEHIDRMRELDSHSTAAIAEKFKGELSHVVPVAGLALGRIHRLLNEHNTVIEHWGNVRKS